MLVIENTTIYKCEHCNKKQFRKGDMTRHEKYCKKNPANMHKCFQFCIHLAKSREPIEGTGDYEEYSKTRCTFTCKATNKKLYSFIAERRNIVMEGEERMPLECPLFKTEFDVNFGEFVTPDENGLLG